MVMLVIWDAIAPIMTYSATVHSLSDVSIRRHSQSPIRALNPPETNGQNDFSSIQIISIRY